MSATHWLYPMSPTGDFEIDDVVKGERVPARIDVVQRNIANDPDLVEPWGIVSGFRLMQPGDLFWVYVSGKQELGAVGEVRDITQDEKGHWWAHVAWNQPATLRLIEDPLPRNVFLQKPQSIQWANAVTALILDDWLANSPLLADVTSLVGGLDIDSIDLGALDTDLDLSPEDARLRVIAEIVRRQGQRRFRAALIDAYGGCAITGETAPWVLQAAHIDPYMGTHSNTPDNGLLLRADLHTLFDNHVIGVDVDNKVTVSTELKGTAYEALDGQELRVPTKSDERPSARKLAGHHAQVLARGPVLH